MTYYDIMNYIRQHPTEKWTVVDDYIYYLGNKVPATNLAGEPINFMNQNVFKSRVASAFAQDGNFLNMEQKNYVGTITQLTPHGCWVRLQNRRPIYCSRKYFVGKDQYNPPVDGQVKLRQFYIKTNKEGTQYYACKRWYCVPTSS